MIVLIMCAFEWLLKSDISSWYKWFIIIKIVDGVVFVI